MTLGTSTHKKRGAGRWGLAALLLAGAALTAPLSLADGPKAPDAPKVTTKSNTVQVIRAEFDGEKDGYEVRNEDGVKTYMRVSRDGSTEKLTREELEAEYDIDVDALLEQTPPAPPAPRQFIARVDGEPGLTALSEAPKGTRLRTMIIDRKDDQSGGSYEVKVENGVRQIFKIEDDGTRTEISEDEMGDVIELEEIIIGDGKRFPMAVGEKKIKIFTSNSDFSHWVTDDDDAVHEFAFGLGGEAGPAMAQARLRSAQSMLESTDRMLADLSNDASKDAQKDLRDATRQLEKARKALEKARLAVEKSGDR